MSVDLDLKRLKKHVFYVSLTRKRVPLLAFYFSLSRLLLSAPRLGFPIEPRARAKRESRESQYVEVIHHVRVHRIHAL